MNTERLERLVRAHGTAGDEGPVRELLRALSEPLADEVRVDPLGNLLVHKKGPGARILLCAHMDGVGVMVTHFEKEGVLRFAPVGGLEPAVLLHAPVRFRSGVCGLISCDEDKLEKPKLRDLFLDIGAKDEQEARSMVQIGDTAMYASPLLTQGSRVIGPYLDDRAGCLALLEVLEASAAPRNDLWFAFTAQEEVGARGAAAVASALAPDCALAVDVTCPDDVPGALHEGTTALGKGAAVKVMDHSVFSHPAVTARLNRLAAERGISVQQDLMLCGGTDAGKMQMVGGGVPVGGVSIPCRYTHAPTELMDRKDYTACVALLRAFCESELEGQI